MVTWDEPKRRGNLRKHGIDLADCEVIFDAPPATEEDDRVAYGERRLQSLGLFYGVVVLLVWVDRPAASHLISVRKAKRHEERRYWQTVGH
ncbi:MAG: BrnT family toxin [Candidatus Competibacter sp.]|nr:BrnT family toxin [Candidatus Competibacter sp.]